jgi:uncharacterized protein (TIGR03067 family)
MIARVPLLFALSLAWLPAATAEEVPITTPKAPEAFLNARLQAAEKEKASLEGTWRVASVTSGGEPTFWPRGGWVSFKGNVLLAGIHLRRPHEGRFRINPAKNPRWIDYTLLHAGSKKPRKVLRGIYRLKKNTLTVCFAKNGTRRPQSFTARAGSGRTLIVLKRSKS